jgi:hypothetical protein
MLASQKGLHSLELVLCALFFTEQKGLLWFGGGGEKFWTILDILK